MKTILTLCFAIILTVTVYAQEPDKALVKVLYNFSHIQDTTQRDKPYTENMLLLVGKTAWAYTSYDRIDKSVNQFYDRQELEKKGYTNDQLNERSRLAPPSKQVSSIQYYYFTREHKFYTLERELFNGFMVESAMEKINWKIAKDTLSFLGVHCQKATANYKGRNWIAWFAPELPFEAGPWKLNGLPGLIVEAYDAKKEVQFKFAGVEKVKEGDMATENAAKMDPKYFGGLWAIATPGVYLSRVELPEKRLVRLGGYTSVDEKEYAKLKAWNDRDHEGFDNAQMAAAGMGDLIGRNKSSGANASGGGATKTVSAPAAQPGKIVFNNPIELPDKK